MHAKLLWLQIWRKWINKTCGCCLVPDTTCVLTHLQCAHTIAAWGTSEAFQCFREQEERTCLSVFFKKSVRMERPIQKFSVMWSVWLVWMNSGAWLLYLLLQCKLLWAHSSSPFWWRRWCCPVMPVPSIAAIAHNEKKEFEFSLDSNLGTLSGKDLAILW